MSFYISPFFIGFGIALVETDYTQTNEM